MQAGTQIGSYRVLSQIGRGGMGTVWLAEHTMLGRRAAIKLLHPMFTSQPDVVKRFFNEARAAAAISDPGIVQIFDFGQHVDGTAYIAMEVLDGEPLNQRLKRLGRLPIAEALRILRQVASSLGVAHQCGIVHRDLKPENIFLVRDPEVPGGERAKLLDFGIAKLTGVAGMHTQTSAVIGTPTYMSPEQCRGAGHVDQRSDIYALGCMLFALLSGRPPFYAPGLGDIIVMHLREEPPRLSSRAPGIPPELDALVMRCLAKDPAYRFDSGTELAAELEILLLGSAAYPANLATTTSPGSQPGSPSGVSGDGQGGPQGEYPRTPSHWPRPAAETTLSQGAHTASIGGGRGAAPLASRRTIWLSAGAVLLVSGAVVAGVASSGDERARGAAAPSAPAPGAGTAATDVAVPAGSGTELTAQMQAVLRGFVEWSRAHVGEPCPTLEALGSPVPSADPWGHPLVLTCTDQPATQRIGVVSTGPDGLLGTRDDVGSWQLAREVTDIVHGVRWPAVAAVTTPARPAPAATPASAPAAAVKPAKVPPPVAAVKPATPPVKPVKPVRKRRSISSDIPTER